MISPKATGQNAQSQFQMGDAVARDAINCIVDFRRREKRKIETKKGLTPGNARYIPIAAMGAIDKRLKPIGKIMVATGSRVAKQKLTGARRNGVAPEMMVAADQTEKRFIGQTV